MQSTGWCQTITVRSAATAEQYGARATFLWTPNSTTSHHHLHLTTWTIILVISVIKPPVCQAANRLMAHFISDKWRMSCYVCSFFFILGMLASRAMRGRENTSPATSITCKLLMIMMPYAVCLWLSLLLFWQTRTPRLCRRGSSGTAGRVQSNLP